ncbi:SRPBCC family protein [Micromonospora sp. CPCC 206061]|uniref:SRPBCC family protein n=1 Tax=Micromonospora sp. CPCC 206061 TaxID=3122410 RepID=UPI002FF01C5F
MAVVERVIDASPERVWAVLADGWTYSDWVVGTAHVRNVDDSWPAPGAHLYHKAGPWPLSLRDKTVVLRSDPHRELVVRPHMWPLGEAEVILSLTEVSPGRTKVTIGEDFTAGPARWLRTKLNDLILHRRNVESLRRLSDVATRQKS